MPTPRPRYRGGEPNPSQTVLPPTTTLLWPSVVGCGLPRPTAVFLCSYPMELNAKVPHEVGVFESLEYLQLVGRLFNGLVVVGLESDLMERKEVIFLIPSTLVHCCSVHYTHQHTALPSCL